MYVCMIMGVYVCMRCVISLALISDMRCHLTTTTCIVVIVNSRQVIVMNKGGGGAHVCMAMGRASGVYVCMAAAAVISARIVAWIRRNNRIAISTQTLVDSGMSFKLLLRRLLSKQQRALFKIQKARVIQIGNDSDLGDEDQHITSADSADLDGNRTRTITKTDLKEWNC